MGASAALTTGSEAESISAHFLDHLVPHPKRGKYGLYHSPTLSFLSPLLAASCGHRDSPPGQGLHTGLLRSSLGGQCPRPPPRPTPGVRLDGAGAAAERSQGPSIQAGEGRGGGCRPIPDVQREAAARPRARRPPWEPCPSPLPLWGPRGAQYPGRRRRGGDRPTLWKSRRPAATAGPASAHRALPGARQTPRGRPGRGLTFAGNPAGRHGGDHRSGPRAQRDLHGWPSRRRRLLLLGGWEVFLLCGFTGRGFNEPPRICI